MAYFPVDDDMSFHPKVLTAGNESIGLWVRAGALSKKHFTGGFVTVETARALGSEVAIDRLVIAGLWVLDSDPRLGDGYRFHDWKQQAGNDDAEVERERAEKSRARNAARQKEWRDRNKESNGVTNAPVTGGPSPSPSPSPMTTTYVNESQSLDNRAREVTDELSAADFKSVVADQYGVDVQRVRAHIIDKLGITLTPTNTVALSVWILNKPKTIPHSPTKYVLGAVTRSPAEIQQHIYEAALV